MYMGKLFPSYLVKLADVCLIVFLRRDSRYIWTQLVSVIIILNRLDGIN